MDRLEAMSIVLAVADAGSLSAAARKLGLPLATVSRKVSQLEAQLKLQLFSRAARKLALTEAGIAYAAASRRILEAVGEAERAAAGEYSAPKGELVVTAPIVFGRLHVLPVVIDFLAAYPEIGIRLALADRVVNLHEEPVDLAVRIGSLPDSSLVAVRAGAIRRVTCASPVYFKRRGVPKTPRDLAEHDCITFEGLMSARRWSFAKGRTEAAVAVRSRLVVNTAEAAIDAAIAGVGITRVLSYQIAAARQAGTLATALEDFEPPPWPVSLVHAGHGAMPLKLRAFLDFAVPRLKARLPAVA